MLDDRFDRSGLHSTALEAAHVVRADGPLADDGQATQAAFAGEQWRADGDRAMPADEPDVLRHARPGQADRCAEPSADAKACSLAETAGCG
jgi:hypothetical protein